VSAALRSIVAFFGFDIDSKKLDDMDKKIEHATGKLEAFGTALAGGVFVRGVVQMIEGTIEIASALEDTSERLGVGVEDLQRFQYAASLVGVSAEEAGTALGFLNKNMGKALGGDAGASQAFAGLHVALKDAAGDVRPLMDVTEDLADSFAGMGSQQERTAKVMEIFGKAGAKMLPILQGGREEVRKTFLEFQALGGGLSTETVAAMDDVGDQMTRLKLVVSSLKGRLVTELLPTLRQWTDRAVQAGICVMDLAKRTNVMKVAMGALALVTGIAAVGALGKLAEAFGIAGKGISGFFKLGFTGMLIVGVLALIALAVEDIYTWLTGGKSAIGDFIDALFGVGASQATIETIKETIAKLGEEFGKLSPLVSAIGDLIHDVFGESAGGLVIDAFRGNLEILVFVVKTAVGELLMVAKVMGDLTDKAAEFADATGISHGFAANIRKHQQEKAATDATSSIGTGSLLGGGNSIPVSELRGGGGVSIGDTRNDIAITVQGGKTPEETGRAVANGARDAMGDQLRNAAGALASFGGG
jgi:hypothetical protein